MRHSTKSLAQCAQIAGPHFLALEPCSMGGPGGNATTLCRTWNIRTSFQDLASRQSHHNRGLDVKVKSPSDLHSCFRRGRLQATCIWPASQLARSILPFCALNEAGIQSRDCILAIDVGTGGTKAALISQSGKILATGFHQHVSTITSSREGISVVEQDPQEWWLATLAATNACFGRLDGSEMTGIRAVAVTGQMQDVILLPTEVDRKPPPAILYSDTRAGLEAEEVARLGGGSERVSAITGTAQGASSLLAKLRWLDRHRPETTAQCSHILFGGHDYVVYKLCGYPCTDATTASTTGLTRCDSPDAYAEDLMREVGLADWLLMLPSMAAPDEPCGQISEAAAVAIGRAEMKGVPVFHSAGDAGATTVGCGAGIPGPLYAYLGTSGWVGGSVSRPNRNGQAADSISPSSTSVPGVFTLAHPDPALVFRTGSIMTAGGNLKWALSLLNDDASTLMLTPKDADELAAREPAGSGGLLYLPYLNGERCPFDDGNARGTFVGLSSSTTKGAMLRAVMEGVAFALKDAELAMASSYSGANAADGNRRLRMVGGGARSSLWPTILSGVFDRSVDVLADAQME